MMTRSTRIARAGTWLANAISWQGRARGAGRFCVAGGSGVVGPVGLRWLAALLCLVLARAEERMPRVLILNSYHPGYGGATGKCSAS